MEVWLTSNLLRLRLGEEKKEEEERTNHSMKIYMVSLLHRATINYITKYSKQLNLTQTKCNVNPALPLMSLLLQSVPETNEHLRS